MLKVRLEPNPLAKLQQLQLYKKKFDSIERERLVDIALNNRPVEENINERISALYVLRDILEKTPASSPDKSLTNIEIQKLYHLIIDEKEFPIVIYPEEFTVEQITHEKNHEDAKYKLEIIKDIEQNDALLRAEAALLIADFGQTTEKYKQLKPRLITAITAILGNMVGEPHHLFLKEVEKDGKQVESVSSRYFNGFVEALYFIDEKAAEHFMKLFNITTKDFNSQRVTNKNTNK